MEDESPSIESEEEQVSKLGLIGVPSPLSTCVIDAEEGLLSPLNSVVRQPSTI